MVISPLKNESPIHLLSISLSTKGFSSDQYSVSVVFRFHQRLREDVVCVSETGAPCQAFKHHEGDQPPARQTAHHPVCANGAELVSPTWKEPDVACPVRRCCCVWTGPRLCNICTLLTAFLLKQEPPKRTRGSERFRHVSDPLCNLLKPEM